MQMKCQQSAICIPMEDVCNGVVDCPFQDDEFFCKTLHNSCPGSCTCLLFAMKCTSWDNDKPESVGSANHYPYVIISVIGQADLSNILPFLQLFKEAVEFNLENTNISEICEPLKLYNRKYILQNASLSRNNLIMLTSGCFSKMPNLRYLNLSYNLIFHLEAKSFYHTPNHFILDISFNKLTHLNNAIFEGKFSLKLLRLDGNIIHDVSFSIFKGVNIENG